MKSFGASIPIGIGDLIYIKAMFEPIKHEFSEINLRFHRELITKYSRHSSYNSFLDEFGKLLFGEKPYVLDNGQYPYCGLSEMVTDYRIVPHKPELAYLLCKGTPLEVGGPYIVINTKTRSLPQYHIEGMMPQFWKLLNQLSEKYKIVILGEKVVEMNTEYQIYTEQHIYSLYTHIYNNVPAERLIDLSVPSLGITTPNLQNIQQDCLIMSQAKFVINFGIGGGFCLATAVANTVGYRYDDDLVADRVFDRIYPNAMITKDWAAFVQKLGQYL
jgi:hypothetical protein